MSTRSGAASSSTGRRGRSSSPRAKSWAAQDPRHHINFKPQALTQALRTHHKRRGRSESPPLPSFNTLLEIAQQLGSDNIVSESQRVLPGREAEVTLQALQHDQGVIPKLIRKNPLDIRFTQDSIASQFENGKTYDEVAVEFLRGSLNAEQFPPIRVLRVNPENDPVEWYSRDNR